MKAISKKNFLLRAEKVNGKRANVVHAKIGELVDVTDEEYRRLGPRYFEKYQPVKK
jgi:hypothetical protein